MNPDENTTWSKAYEESGTQLRYYMGWRERLLAGYLAGVGSIAYGIHSVGFDSGEGRALMVALMFLSWFALALDTRNYDLLCHATNSGAGLEDMAKLPRDQNGTELGAFQRLRDQERRKTFPQADAGRPPAPADLVLARQLTFKTGHAAALRILFGAVFVASGAALCVSMGGWYTGASGNNSEPADPVISHLPTATSVDLSTRAVAFLVGAALLLPLDLVVRRTVTTIRKKGATLGAFREEEATGNALATVIGRVEMCLFYFAALAGAQSFSTLAMGWMLLKGVHQWSQFVRIETAPPPEGADEAPRPGLSGEALGRNRFLVFAVGTALAIAAGGVAGAGFFAMADILAR